VEVIDKVYGKYKIKEKVLIELIKTPAIQRLKKIRQQGLPKEWNNGIEFTRYDHSIGVMILLDKLGAPLKERIAGLLHDVSHMAFSHVYDYLVENYNESHGDDEFYKYLKKNTKIQNVLIKYGYSIEDFKDLEKFKLLENHAPDLCADRVDYTLREFIEFKNNYSKLNQIINDLVVVGQEIIFKTKRSAKDFYEMYDYFQANHLGSINHHLNYNVFVDILKRALELKLIKMNDFYKDDEYILKKLKRSKDTIITSGINKLITKEFEIPKNKKLFTGKKRFVNPKYLDKHKKTLYLLDTTK